MANLSFKSAVKITLWLIFDLSKDPDLDTYFNHL